MDADRGGGVRRSSPLSTDELWAGLVAEVAVMPDVVANLLREHQPDAQGYCRGNGCGTAGRGVPTTRWPCALHTLASRAEAAARGRPSGPAADRSAARPENG